MKFLHAIAAVTLLATPVLAAAQDEHGNRGNGGHGEARGHGGGPGGGHEGRGNGPAPSQPMARPAERPMVVPNMGRPAEVRRHDDRPGSFRPGDRPDDRMARPAYRADGDRHGDNRPAVQGRWHGNRWAGQRYSAPRYVYPGGYSYRRWSPGLILPGVFLGSSYYWDDYSDFGLFAPPYGYRWVRYGPDLLLVNVRNGRIRDVRYGVFG